MKFEEITLNKILGNKKMNKKEKFILSIDQGTSATKVLVFNNKGIAIAKGEAKLHTNYKDNGFVEQDPNAIYESVLIAIKNCTKAFIKLGFDKQQIVSIGISNQRETFVLWDNSGKPLCNAIVWQCKRSVNVCKNLQKQQLDKTIHQKTGLFIDPYFSATKIIWLVKNNAIIKNAIKNKEAYFGTIDTWLLYKLTNGKSYCTDHTNASRTMLFNLNILQWDKDLLQKFGLQFLNLPEVKASSAFYGTTNCNNIFKHNLTINALIGDSHAASFGEGCVTNGLAKATMGTGCSVLMNIGNKPKFSKNGMVTTICFSAANTVHYALEGVIVSCGATIEWLKNELHLFTNSAATQQMAEAVNDCNGVVIVPAFSGLGSPHWQMQRKASITGVSFGTTKNHIVRAALESIAYQLKDIMDAMQKDAKIELQQLNVNGGIAANEFVVSFLANLLEKKIVKIGITDVSALGAAYLAGLDCGIFKNIEQIATLNRNKKVYKSNVKSVVENIGYKNWQEVIKIKNL
jgi:glycerol kinase